MYSPSLFSASTTKLMPRYELVKESVEIGNELGALLELKGGFTPIVDLTPNTDLNWCMTKNSERPYVPPDRPY